jgi:O-succinylbenzoic acid--CoA ligase
VACSLDDPVATAAFFREGYFYLGDLGVIGGDGRFSIEGRVSNVINVMESKYATTPIETALQEALNTEAVCVSSVADEDGEAVHVALQPRGVITNGALRAALLEALPAMPHVWVHAVKNFPRNHFGKVERSSLKAQLLSNDEVEPAG